MASGSRFALQELHTLLEPVLHYFREVAGQTLQPTYSINAFCWPISYLSESKMPAAVRVFEQTAKYSLRVTLLASVAYSGNKPVYTVMIQPNSSHESLCVMAREGSFLSARFLLKTALERGASVLRWGRQLRDWFFYSTLGILCASFLQRMALTLLLTGVNEEAF